MDHRGNPDLHLRHAEPRVMRGNPEIASGGEFEAAAEAPAEDVERAGVADRQADHAARVAIDAAIGIEHVHGQSRKEWSGYADATSEPKRGRVKGSRGSRPAAPLRDGRHFVSMSLIIYRGNTP